MADIGDHAARLLELVGEFERSPDRETREKAMELLEHVDHLHRSGVWRLFELMTELGGKGLVERITLDPAVKALFVLYDLIPADPLQPVAAELQAPPSRAPAGFVPLQAVLGRAPQWRLTVDQQDLRPGALTAIQVDGTPVVLCRLADEVFAYRNACGRSALPLHLGSLHDAEIRCPWHSCRFDARSGRRLAGTGADLQPFAVDIRQGLVYIATTTGAGGVSTGSEGNR